MALKVEALVREFKYKGSILADPNPKATPDQVREIYAAQYPELTNAVIGDGEQGDGKVVYEFSVSAGTKG